MVTVWCIPTHWMGRLRQLPCLLQKLLLIRDFVDTVAFLIVLVNLTAVPQASLLNPGAHGSGSMP